jgi:hypothetical protein
MGRLFGRSQDLNNASLSLLVVLFYIALHPARRLLCPVRVWLPTSVELGRADPAEVAAARKGRLGSYSCHPHCRSLVLVGEVREPRTPHNIGVLTGTRGLKGGDGGVSAVFDSDVTAGNLNSGSFST